MFVTVKRNEVFKKKTERQHFRSQLCLCFPAKKHLTWWNRQIELFSVTGHQSS